MRGRRPKIFAVLIVVLFAGGWYARNELGLEFSRESIERLVEEGKLELDAPVHQYLTRWDLPSSIYDSNKVTIRRLLSHTAGTATRMFTRVQIAPIAANSI